MNSKKGRKRRRKKGINVGGGRSGARNGPFEAAARCRPSAWAVTRWWVGGEMRVQPGGNPLAVPEMVMSPGNRPSGRARRLGARTRNAPAAAMLLSLACYDGRGAAAGVATATAGWKTDGMEGRWGCSRDLALRTVRHTTFPTSFIDAVDRAHAVYSPSPRSGAPQMLPQTASKSRVGGHSSCPLVRRVVLERRS